MAELTNPEDRERLEHEAPDEYMRRREFLQRTALTAGLATGLATVLPSNALVAEAAKRQRRRPLPSPKNLPVDTIVVLMMENRSFDHYLGWMPHADGRQAGLSYADKSGKSFSTKPLAPDWQGCGFNDPDHSWEGGRTQLNGGRCDGFLRSGGNDELSISYYREKDLGFLPAAAKEFTTFDHFHCSLMGPTLPNREYMHAAQSYGMITNDFPTPPGFPDTTIFASLKKKGVSSRYFFCDVPVSALWGAPGLARSGPVEEYYARCAGGTLPHVSFVDPNFGGSVGEDPGISGDEHPARRRAHRAGVHVRRGARVHGVAAVEARRAVRHLRRVGRLLRPRRAAAGAGHAQLVRHQQGLRADGLPDPGRAGLAVGQAPPREPLDVRLRVDPQADR